MQPRTPTQATIVDSQILTSGFNCVLQLPTGAGKTWLAGSAIAEVFQRGHKAIFVVPLRALAEELRQRWQLEFAPKKVGAFTSDYEDDYPVGFGEADLLIFTPERLDLVTRFWRDHWDWLPLVDLCVVDEFHLLGDSSRGARIECGLSRLRLINPFCQIIGLSATLGNRQELASWLDGIEFYSKERPVPLRWEIETFKNTEDKQNKLTSLLQRTPQQALIFVQSRKRAEKICAFLKKHRINADYHHAGLARQQRHNVEEKFKKNLIQFIVCTPTLAMGINLPVRAVILYDLSFYNGSHFSPLPVIDVWQRAGRAGRPGLDLEGVAYLFTPAWIKGEADQYLSGKFETIQSTLTQRRVLTEQIIAEVASGLARTPRQLERNFSRSLAQHQGYDLAIADLVGEARQAKMLTGEEELRVTPFGWVAVRHLLQPKTVQVVMETLSSYPNALFLFDLLILVAAVIDAPVQIRVDYENIQDLQSLLERVPSLFLDLGNENLETILGIRGKRLLTAINTAAVALRWTEVGSSQQVAQEFQCYPFEIELIAEGYPRILLAIKAIAKILEIGSHESITVEEQINILEKMCAYGFGTATATLTLIPGIGGLTAQKLYKHGVKDIEDLGEQEISTLTALSGIGEVSAKKWIDTANELVDSNFSASRYRETPTKRNFPASERPPTDVDLYRLRRALELKVTPLNNEEFTVSGGNSPHRTTRNTCDCRDRVNCKHIYAVNLYLGNYKLRKIAEDFQQGDTLNFFDLWKIG